MDNKIIAAQERFELERQNNNDDDEEEDNSNDDKEEDSLIENQCFVCELPVDGNITCDSCVYHICDMCYQMSERIEELDEFGTDDETDDSFGGEIICTNFYLMYGQLIEDN